MPPKFQPATVDVPNWIEAEVLVRLRVAQLDVGVEVDVVAAAHLAGVVDVELWRARRELNAAEREAAGVLVGAERCGPPAQRRARRIELM